MNKQKIRHDLLDSKILVPLKRVATTLRNALKIVLLSFHKASLDFQHLKVFTFSIV